MSERSSLQKLLREKREIQLMERIHDTVIDIDSANERLRFIAEQLLNEDNSKPLIVSTMMINHMIDQLREALAAATLEED